MVHKSTNQLKLCSQGRSAAANNMRECISIHIGQVGEYPDNDDDDDDDDDDDINDPPWSGGHPDGQRLLGALLPGARDPA